MTDDQRQLIYERQRLADAETKLARARDEGTRFFYQCAVREWRRSIAVLERQIYQTVGRIEGNHDSD